MEDGEPEKREWTMADFADCLDSPEGTKAELEALEARLAKERGLEPTSARGTLVALDDAGLLDDTPLVADWRATYARFLDWTDELEGASVVGR